MARVLWQAACVIVIAEEVQDALAEGRALVALESTIIAHGLPHPDNVQLARALEAKVREHGAVPATIAVLRGQARIGLDADGLERLGDPKIRIAKAGAADLPVAFAKGLDAATTVSATSELAAMAGLRVFATGGLGGVHRGDQWDVSADLMSLARIPIAVVCAGPKAILDVPRTAEALESLGVLVLGYQTSELPAFYCRDSGIALEHRVESAEEAAACMFGRWHVLVQGGVLIANPAPAEHALPRQSVDAWIAQALQAADEAGVTGKAITPFLLQFMAKASGNQSVATNCALALSNAEVAAQIAVAYAEKLAD